MTKQLAGIHGVLGNYVTQTASEVSAPAVAPDSQAKRSTKAKRPADQVKRRTSARLGRPPGRSREKASLKEKATLRIDAELMADYREWSWEERCQLGELVERALADYRQRRR